MHTTRVALVLLVLTGLVSACASGGRSLPDAAPPAVASVDLVRYAGLWYQVARYPHFFQRRECHVSTARYTLREDGAIEVRNDCWADEVGGERNQTVRAIARPADESNAWLVVRFYGIFAADYLIIELDPDYEWAVVTTPDAETLWILSREPALDEEVYASLLNRLERRGFVREDIIRTSLQ